MRNRYAGIIFLCLFLLEGTLVLWLIPSGWQQKLSLAPHFTLIALLIYSMHRNRHIALMFGLVIGLIHDIVYASPMIGPHSFGMAIVAYVAGIAAKRIKLNIAITFIILTLSIVLYDGIVFSLYRLFRVTVMPYVTMLTDHLLPTLLLNLLFAIFIYVPLRKLLEMKIEKREEEG